MLEGRRGGWKYAFERCAEAQARRGAEGGGGGGGGRTEAKSGKRTSIFSIYDEPASPPLAGHSPSASPPSPSSSSSAAAYRACRLYNAAVSSHLSKLSSATSALSSLRKCASRSQGLSKAARAEAKADEFRAEAYKKAAKVVLDYPVPVTVASIAVQATDAADKDAVHKKKNRARVDSGKPPCKEDEANKRRRKSTVRSPCEWMDDHFTGGGGGGGGNASGRHASGGGSTQGSLPSLPKSVPTPLRLASSFSSSPPAAASPAAALLPPSPTNRNLYLHSSPSRLKRLRQNDPANPPPIRCGGSVRRRLVNAILHFYPLHYPCRSDLPAAAAYSYLDGEEWKSDSALLENPSIKSMVEFRKIWGVGPSTAAQLVQWGVGGVEELRRDRDVMKVLNPQQVVGVRRYEDINAKIPRAEATAILERVSEAAERVSGGRVNCTACGSYRRGSLTSGDVDVLILPKEGESDRLACEVFVAVLRDLESSGFLTDHLAIPGQFGENDGEEPGSDAKSYMGVCLLERGGVHRRLDLKAYPGCQGAFALMYFTGSAHFNRSLRAFCKRAGLTLSDAGLALCKREGGRKVKVWESVVCEREEDVFDALGIEYVRPECRDVGVGVGWEGTGGGGKGGGGGGGGEEANDVAKYWDDCLYHVDDDSDYGDGDEEENEEEEEEECEEGDEVEEREEGEEKEE